MNKRERCGRVLEARRWEHYVTAEGCRVSSCETARGPVVVLRGPRPARRRAAERPL